MNHLDQPTADLVETAQALQQLASSLDGRLVLPGDATGTPHARLGTSRSTSNPRRS